MSLPAGFTVRLSARTKVCDGGTALVGGSRGSVLYLSPAAAHLLGGEGVVAAAPGAAEALARSLLDRGFADPWWSDPPGSDADVTDVTVVVPVRDRPLDLARLLDALPPSVPVVVVDDASRSPGPVAGVARRHGATLVVHEANRGPAAARNSGLRRVTTPYVAFCDSDVVPDRGWLATLRRHLDDPALAVVAPRVLGPTARADDGWIERYEQARSSLDLGPEPAAVRQQGMVSYLPSACLVARVDALGDGFDEALRCGEDVDLVWRLLASGVGVRYEPAATVRHRHRAELREWLGRKAFYGTSAAPLAERHGTAVAPMVLSPWSAVLAGAVLAQRRWSVPVALGAAAVATAGTARRLGRSEHPVRAAAVLTLEGSVAVVWQTAAALTRHYWPVAALAALGSRRARRAVVVAAVVDGLVDRRRVGADLDPVRYVLARRLDDLAYGAGVWSGALRARSPRALLPAMRGPHRRA
ncbi:mycofactocin biosynthesis glycosyltransferase MftF [Nocardioides currus]|uniref:Mycofactocin system glycosyltransferase n=1 Tax=Nocardioides currus TaxID=2133958 RepID=A0A2R7YZ14_9ACTN|nr:mycofactocin biosynthesis glycosyltransferase MftF [Nocardioides currus]PUA81628.1 mycofactocin system glycosyltransferase [Nocardioides currus]